MIEKMGINPYARAHGPEGALAGGATAGKSALRGLCEEFEAVFIRQILESARIFDDSEGSGHGVPWLDAGGELARALAEKGCMGLAEVLEARLSGR